MWISVLLALAAFLALAFRGRGYLAWTLAAATALLGWWGSGVDSPALFRASVLALAAAAAVFGFAPLRRGLMSRAAMRRMGAVLPRLGETERVALEAGTVWWDAALFSGMPPWQELLDFRVQPLSAEEQAFLDGPVEELCRRLNDWEVHQLRDLPAPIWAFLKTHRFFGMIIPKEYGGWGFSAIAHSRVVTKISSRSVACAVTVMVPNSLGPAELLALRQRGAEASAAAAPGLRRRGPLLRPHRPRGRLGRRGDAVAGHRREAPGRRPRSAGHAPDLAQALHHPGTGRHPGGPRLSPEGS